MADYEQRVATGTAARKRAYAGRLVGDEEAGADDQSVAAEQPAEEASRDEQRAAPSTILSIEDLVGARVVTRNGEPRGTVVDVLTSPPPDLRIVALIVGTWGWLQRLRVAVRLRNRVPQATRLQAIGWETVDRWDGLRIVLRDDPPVREIDVELGPEGQIQPGKPLEPREPGDQASSHGDPA